MMIPKPRATLQVGDKGSFSKTITEKDVFEFADATHDSSDSEEHRRLVHGVA